MPFGTDATLVLIQGDQMTSFKLEDEFVEVSYSQRNEDFEAEAIFVGHGISALSLAGMITKTST